MATDNVNWDELRDAYIGNPSASYRKLAKQFGISYNAVWRRARDEHWVELKSKSAIEAATIAASSIASARAEGASCVVSSARGLLKEFDKTVEELGKSGIIKPKSLKDLADALRAIQQTMDSQPTELDIQEQKARIAKIQKEAMLEDAQANDVRVTMLGLEEFAV